MKRFLVQTEIDRVTREADDEEIDTQSSVLRVTARPLTAAGLGEVSMTIETNADEVVGVRTLCRRGRSWGCCAEQKSHEVYSLYSGKRLFSATGDRRFRRLADHGQEGPEL